MNNKDRSKKTNATKAEAITTAPTTQQIQQQKSELMLRTVAKTTKQKQRIAS